MESGPETISRNPGRAGPFLLGPLIATGRYWVHEGWDQNGRDVAIRFPVLGNTASQAEDCRREATALAQISAPNVVKLVTHSTSSRPFVAVELVRGQSLAVPAQSKRPIQEIHRFGEEILDALDAMHAQGFTHRNISLESIMIGNRGEVTLVSFGRVRLAARPTDIRMDITLFARAFLKILSEARESRLAGPLQLLLTRAEGGLQFRSVAALREAWLDAGVALAVSDTKPILQLIDEAAEALQSSSGERRVWARTLRSREDNPQTPRHTGQTLRLSAR